MPAHPEDELLADLAADVLPIDVARQVEAHVMGCARCSQVLSGAESVSTWLRQAPPEPMPPQVRARLEQSLSAVRQGREPQPMPRRATGLPGAVGVPGSAPPANAPLRRGGRTGPQPQNPNPNPNPQAVPGRSPQPQRPGAPTGQPGPQRPQVPPRTQPPARPQQPERPAAAQAHRPAELQGKGVQPAPNTSSYTVRPLQPKREEAFPAEDPTMVRPAFRDEGPDPELTQPVRKRRSRPAAPPPETSGMTTLMRPVRGERPPGKLTRMDSTQTVRVRRQALEEQKADEPSRWPRISPQIAAALVLVMALAGGVVFLQVRGGGSASDSAGTAASASSAAPLMLTTVGESGTKYKKSAFKSQIDKLVTSRNQALSAPSGQAEANSADGTMSAQDTGPKTTGDQASAGDSTAGGSAATEAAGNELLKSPEALQACLKAIGQQGEQPLAVDLATYEGREAALVVLPGTSGGYEVWIVARTCQPGNDGTVDVVAVKS